MQDYSHLLDRIIDHAQAQFKLVDTLSFEHKPSPEKWSKKEILGHLIDSSYNNQRRFLQAVTQQDLIFDGYDQVQWVKSNLYQDRTVEELVQTWSTVNHHMRFLISGLSLDVLQRSTSQHNFHRICMNRIGEGQASSLAYLIWDYLFHVEHHLAQILPNHQKILGPWDQ